MPLPDLFVVGAPKAGTTALHAALAGHPALHMSPVKEPKFYLCDERPPPKQGGPGDNHSLREWVWHRDRYEALFEYAPPGALKGESTPFYLWSRSAQRRIAREIPREVRGGRPRPGGPRLLELDPPLVRRPRAGG